VKTKSLKKTKERLKEPIKEDSCTATVSGSGGERRGPRSMAGGTLRAATDMGTNSLLMNTYTRSDYAMDREPLLTWQQTPFL
jgi:hypothetical protein